MLNRQTSCKYWDLELRRWYLFPETSGDQDLSLSQSHNKNADI
jgi:hypothetical protein